MDYKYIEQLVERYFQCETSLQEEQILKAFFAQPAQDVPEQLLKYMPVFAAMQPEEALGDDFDERVLALIDEPQAVKARVIGIGERLRPLLRAAAVVAVLFTMGTIADRSMQAEQPQGDEINYSAYKDTYDDPSMAYDQVEDALELISDGFSIVRKADSTRIDSLYSELR
jgi:hypothetical protein